MTGLLKREHKAVEPTDATESPETVDLFDRMYDDWMRMWPFRRPALLTRRMPEDMIRVEELRENGTLLVRAELPGIDPDKDVELTVADGILEIRVPVSLPEPATKIPVTRP